MKRGRTALYRLFDANQRLLYVGIGETAATRWQSHRAQKPWWDDVARAEVVWYPTRAEAESEELRAIETEFPVYNVMGTRSRLKAPTASVPLPGSEVYVDDIARYLDLSKGYVRQFLANRSGFPAPCRRVRNRLLWKADEVRAWAEANRQFAG